MQRQRYQRSPLYLFNPAHRDFVDGDVDKFPTAITGKFAIRQFVYLFLLIALPMVIFITAMVALVGYRVEFLLLVELFTALMTCTYFVLGAFLKDRVLYNEGNIIYGKVIRQEQMPGYSKIATSTVTRIFYHFINPEQERVIASIDLNYMRHSLPDGRKYPVEGTPVAILYANDKNHKLL